MSRALAVVSAAASAFVVATTLFAPSALAQAEAQEAAPDDSATEQARALFMEGLELADASDWERAVLRFRQALELRDAAPVRFNLATSLGRMGRRIEAIEELDRLLAADPERALQQTATDLRAELSSELGRLRVNVAGDTSALTVTVDGRPWPAIGVDTPADPGVRVVRLLRGDAELDVEEAEVEVGALSEVTLDRPAAAASGEGDDLLIGLLVGGGAALVVAGAIVLAVVLVDGQSAGGDFDPPTIVVD